MVKYHIFNRDCIEHIDLINDGIIDSVIIDPPYCQTHTGLREKYNQANIEFDRKKFFELATKKCKQQATFGIFGYGETLYRDVIMLIDLGWSFHHEFIWNKGVGSLPTHKIPKMHETFIALNRGGKSITEAFISDFYSKCNITFENYKKLENRFNDLIKTLKKLDAEQIKQVMDNIDNRNYVLQPKAYNEELNTAVLDGREVFIKNTFNKRVGTIIDIASPSNRFHPTQKPDVLMNIIVKMLSSENDLVVDFFMGSGSTGVAALQNNRNFVGFEVFNDYYKIAEQRLKDIKNQNNLF